ncbi:MAG TPA: efflux RND transporter permease subunit [Bryobacteraceae bacterium]|jgi:multidrug efflux pump subunit AcrB|nr:efflux RND transporter permease subunit [Bryobacteraceae bacterium]
MWIVKLALRRPYTFVVGALLILVLGIVTITRMRVDIFPQINIPVVSVVWLYAGLSPQEMERRIVTISERAATTAVNDIEHMESQSLNGIGVVRIYFQEGTRIDAAVAQVAAIMAQITRVLPPSITPPYVIQYDASTVPIIQGSLSGAAYSEAELYDFAANFIRTQLATVQGASVPMPFGGRPRQIMVDLDPREMLAKGISAANVSEAINAQSLILPGGTAKFGDRIYNVQMNSSPEAVSELNDMPIKLVKGTPVYIRDVAQVRDGFAVQQSLVRKDGQRGVLITILRNGNASTLGVANRVRAALPKIMATLPKDLHLNLLFDQSRFVRAAIKGVTREAVIAAGLTALMILLFLGSWRSTLIVAVSIPLSILVSIVVLSLFGQTINVMTLGGLALAVGILVDDATVEIENIHRNQAMGKPIVSAILDGAQQIAVPAFVSTLAICIVFVPVIFLSGAAKSLFTPLAMAVVFAMMASYLLSRTLVPTMAKYLLPGEHASADSQPDTRSVFGRFHQSFEGAFEHMREIYRDLLGRALAHPRLTLSTFAVLALLAVILTPYLGQDFFPSVDAGQFRLHVRAPAGTRLEETEHVFSRVEQLIRDVVPPRDLDMLLDNIGLPNNSGSAIAFSDGSTVGTSDGEILASLKVGHAPVADYMSRLRVDLRHRFPELTCFFQPSDIVSEILDFGLPSPIDVQVVGRDLESDYRIAREITAKVERIPGAVDVHVHQIVDAPEIDVNVDRTRAVLVGMEQKDVANSLLVSLASSGQIAPNYWVNPKNGVSYLIAVQTPEYKLASLEDLQSTALMTAGQNSPQLLQNLATTKRFISPAVVNHYNVQPVFDVFAAVQNRDLGGVANDIERVLVNMRMKMPRGTSIVMRGQVQSMRESFVGLGYGLLFAVLLVYFLMVVNFQSWLDPLIIMMALPGAFSGIVLMLFATQTTLSVPSLMGAIMSVGVATANSILLITFANDNRPGLTAREAALEAGYVRLRPVLMTAAAMIVGMLPMALGLGEGGEQNAPLGRAVIGGLLLATLATLFLVPVIYSTLRRSPAFMEEPVLW